MLSGLFTRLLRLLLRAEGRAPDVTDETWTGVLRPVATLQREMSVGHVLRRIRGQWLISFDRRPLLFHFHVTQNGDQHHEDHEAHAATHNQAQPSREDIRQTAPVAHRAITHNRVRRVQSSDLGTPARRRIHHHGQRRSLDHVIVRGVPLPGADVLRDRCAPAAQAKYTDQVARVRCQLRQFYRTCFWI